MSIPILIIVAIDASRKVGQKSELLMVNLFHSITFFNSTSRDIPSACWYPLCGKTVIVYLRYALCYLSALVQDGRFSSNTIAESHGNNGLVGMGNSFVYSLAFEGPPYGMAMALIECTTSFFFTLITYTPRSRDGCSTVTTLELMLWR